MTECSILKIEYPHLNHFFFLTSFIMDIQGDVEKFSAQPTLQNLNKQPNISISFGIISWLVWVHFSITLLEN